MSFFSCSINKQEKEANVKIENQKPATQLLEDGIYEVEEYNRNLPLEEAKLYPHPAITTDYFKEVKKVKNVNEFVTEFRILVNFTDKGTKKLEEFTTKNIDKFVAVVLNHKIVMIPTVLHPITGGSIEISGAYEEAEIDEFVKAFNQSIK